MERTFGQIVASEIGALSLVEWYRYCHQRPTFVPPMPITVKNYSTGAGLFRWRPYSFDVLHNGEHSVSLHFSNNHNKIPNSICVSYADGHLKLAQLVSKELAQAFDGRIVTASPKLVWVEQILCEIGVEKLEKFAIKIRFADDEHIGEFSYTEMPQRWSWQTDYDGQLNYHLIDVANQKYCEGLAFIHVSEIEEIALTDIDLSTIRAPGS